MILIAIAVIAFMQYRKLSTLLKFGIIITIALSTGMGQEDEVLDDKPVVLPDIDEVGKSFGPMLGLPKVDDGNYYQDEMLWRLGIAAFLQDDINLTNNSLFYA